MEKQIDLLEDINGTVGQDMARLQTAFFSSIDQQMATGGGGRGLGVNSHIIGNLSNSG